MKYAGVVTIFLPENLNHEIPKTFTMRQKKR